MAASSRSVRCAALALLLAPLIVTACTLLPAKRSSVVVYTSVDRVFSEPILNAFEAETGIKVLPVYDVEAAKTTGLVNRLVAEKSRPKADVFWSGEFVMTIALQEQGVLAPYDSPEAADIPATFRDPDGYWTGFAGRARVLIINADEVAPADYPGSIDDLLDPAWPADRVGIAQPLFGTTATHAAALYSTLGPDRGRAYFTALRDRNVRVVDGNSVVRDLAVSGQLLFGLTDTDDACSAIERGDPVTIVYPDQGDGQMGTLIIPNTVALIAGGPNPDAGRALIDYLVSARVEGMLVESGWSHAPVRPLEVDIPCTDVTDVRPMEVDYGAVYRQLDASRDELTALFVR